MNFLKNIALGEGRLFMKDEPIAEVKHSDLIVDDLVGDIEYDLIPLSLASKEATFAASIETDIPTLEELAGTPDREPFFMRYSEQYWEQARRHKKKRINKKWAKRYGYVAKWRTYQMDNVHVIQDEDGVRFIADPPRVITDSR